MTIKIGIIGGSGFYQLSEDSRLKTIKTPFGETNIQLSDIGGKEVAFITRHGKGHKTPPHLVNYRANIFALHSLGVNRIISSSAVGSMEESIKPGSFVIPNQFIDFTIGRPKTFFDGKFSIKLHNGQEKKGVIHTDVTEPYCSLLRKGLANSIKENGGQCQESGTYVCTEGPRFETPAEINAFRILGGTLVGMTSVSECILARELDICYATLCLVTNLAAGLQERISVEEVFEIFNKKISEVKKIITSTVSSININDKCKC